MDGEQEIDREEQAVGIGLPHLLERPDRDGDIDLEDHDAPPFPEIPVPEAGQEEIQETGNERVLLYARSLV